MSIILSAKGLSWEILWVHANKIDWKYIFKDTTLISLNFRLVWVWEFEVQSIIRFFILIIMGANSLLCLIIRPWLYPVSSLRWVKIFSLDVYVLCIGMMDRFWSLSWWWPPLYTNEKSLSMCIWNSAYVLTLY